MRAILASTAYAATMVAGTEAPTIGYSSGFYGSLSPAKFKTATILSIRDNSPITVIAMLDLVIVGAGDYILPQTFFSQISANGLTLHTSQVSEFTSSSSGGDRVTHWRWAGQSFGFVNGNSYTIRIS